MACGAGWWFVGFTVLVDGFESGSWTRLRRTYESVSYSGANSDVLLAAADEEGDQRREGYEYC